MNIPSRPGLNALLYTIGVGSLAVISIAIGVRIFQDWRDRQQEKQAFEQLQTFSTQGNHEACINAAKHIAPTSRFYTEAQSLGDQCTFLLGKTLTQGGEIRSALSVLLAIPKSAQTYPAAQALVEDLSAEVIETAQAQVVDGKLDEAIVTLAQIPLEAPAAATAQNLRESWRKEWKDNEETIAQAEKALEEGEWSTAQDILAKVSSAPYWQEQIAPLQEKAEAGIEEVIRYEQQQQKARAAQAEREARTQFNNRLQSLYDTYVKEGMNELDAWKLACETIGGTIEDVGPEAICQP